MHEKLAAAESANTALRASRIDRWYPNFHIAAPAGWINDPNGLSFFKGRYQVYFQHHPFSSVWGPMHWGHVSSANLVTWKREPIALAPSLEADSGGVYSGSAVEVNGELYAYYTGNRWLNPANRDDGNVQVQCLATSSDGVVFEKKGVLIDGVHLANFRDPKVFSYRGSHYMVIGATSDESRGQVHLYSSRDMLSWVFEGVIYEDPRDDVFMLECPDLFQLGEYWVLMFCPERPTPAGYNNRNTHNAGYVVGSWQPGSVFEPLSGYRPLDWGANFYAPQTFLTGDGRRAMFGWMGSFGIPTASHVEGDGWSGQLTVPRELRLTKDLKLTNFPVSELVQLRSATRDFGAFTVGANESLVVQENADSCEIELEVNLASSSSERMGLDIMKTATGQVYVGYDGQSQRIFIDRRLAGYGDRGYRSAPYPGGERLSLRVLVDCGSVEVFVNGGLESLSSLAFPAEGERSVVLSSESGSIAVESLRVHALDGIWEDPNER
ncbi:MAG: glycoside hydrolase family 32 protein [Rothia sp. (in: high G+C Gram-positive bacteria)]|nr:glycoside hydrolase family 32 protein [Rothia sp. (in: high G+C Gram-positive bacteria)]